MSATTAIDAPRERTFAFLSDLANRPAICDHFLAEFRLQRLESAGAGAAARFLIRRPKMWMETVIEEIEPSHRISEGGRAGRLGRIPAFTVWEVLEGAAPDACEVTVTFWTEPTHALDRVREARRGGRWYRRQWARSLARLKDTIENERPVERVAVAGGNHLAASPTVA